MTHLWQKALPVDKILFAAFAICALVVQSAPVSAESLRYFVENGMPYVEGQGAICALGSSQPSDSGSSGVPEVAVDMYNSSLQSNIEQNKSAYEAGAQASGVPWTMIAALHSREATADPNKSILSGEPIGSTNPDNAHLSCNTLEECAVNAGNHLKRLAKDVYDIEISESGDHTLEELAEIFVAYNRGNAYKVGWLAGFSSRPANPVPVSALDSPYAMNYFDDERIGMRWPDSPVEPSSTRGQGNQSLGTVTVYTILGGAVGACGGSSEAYVNEDGYAFPVGLPKLDASNGWTVFDGTNAPDPYCPTPTCHHDRSGAFDIAHRETVYDDKDAPSVGVPVYAITDGTIISRKDIYAGQSGCNTFQLESDVDQNESNLTQGNGKWKYWYGHIENASVIEGQPVKAGQQIAEIGERRCTGNGSYPHLHIDRGSPQGRHGGSLGYRDPGFVQRMNDIYKKWPG